MQCHSLKQSANILQIDRIKLMDKILLLKLGHYFCCFVGISAKQDILSLIMLDHHAFQCLMTQHN